MHILDGLNKVRLTENEVNAFGLIDLDEVDIHRDCLHVPE